MKIFNLIRPFWLGVRWFLELFLSRKTVDGGLEKLGFFDFKSKVFRSVLELPGGISIVCRPDDEAIVTEIFEKNEYACASISKGDVIFDVGAHIGLFTVYAGKKNPTGKIFSFEPAPLNQDLFRENIKRNRLDNVTLHACAVSDHEGTATLNFPGYHAGYTFSTEQPSATSTQVNMKTLDGAFSEAGLSVCHLLKIDVERHELPVLKGASKMLAMTRQVILELPKENNIPEEVRALLSDQGFRCSVEWENPGALLLYAKRND